MQLVIVMYILTMCNRDDISIMDFIDIYKSEAVPQLLIVADRIMTIRGETTEVSCSYDKTENGLQPIPGKSTKLTNRFARNASNIVLTTTRYENGNDGRIASEVAIGSNSLYSFSVEKNVQTGKYFVKEYGIPLSDREIRNKVGFYGYIYALDEMHPDQYFIKNGDVIEKIIRNHDEYVLHYRIKDVNKYSGKESYVVSYKPSLMWQKSYEKYIYNGFKMNVMYSYIKCNGVHLVSKIRHEYESLLKNEKGKLSTLEFMFSYIDDGKIHDDEFTLSAFGLPEPHGITWERPTPWWIYFGLIGGGCLVGFVLIGVFLRRRYGAS